MAIIPDSGRISVNQIKVQNLPDPDGEVRLLSYDENGHLVDGGIMPDITDINAGPGLSINESNEIQLGDNETVLFSPRTGNNFDGNLTIRGSFGNYHENPFASIETFFKDGAYNILADGQGYNNITGFAGSANETSIESNSGGRSTHIFKRDDAVNAYIIIRSREENSVHEFIIGKHEGQWNTLFNDTSPVPKGIDYGGDYEPNFGPRTLVTKQFVEDYVSDFIPEDGLFVLPEMTTAERDALTGLESDTIINHGGVPEKWTGSSFVPLVPVRIGNAAGTEQFQITNNDILRVEGTGDTSISFDPSTNRIIINSSGGTGGTSGVDSFNGRTGAVTSQSGDYNTSQVTEGTNLYFTQARVRSSVLTGLSLSSSAVTASDTVIQAFGKLQGQINGVFARTLTINGTAGSVSVAGGTQNLSANRTWTVSLVPTGVSPGTYTKLTVDTLGRVTAGAQIIADDIPNLPASKITSGTFNIARIPTGTTGTTVALGNHTHATLTRGTGLTGNNYNGSNPTTWAFDTVFGDNRYHQTLSLGGTAGNIAISSGNSVTLNSLGRVTLTNISGDFNNLPVGFHPFSNTTGSTGFPTATGGGFLYKRSGAGNNNGSFILSKRNTTGGFLELALGDGSGWGAWETLASREWVTSQGFAFAGTGATQVRNNSQLDGRYALRSVVLSTSNGITGGGDLTANRSFSLTGQALSLHNLGTNGLFTRVSSSSVAARTITGTSPIVVTNGNGVSGNPVVSLDSNYQVDRTFISKGVKTTGAWTIGPADQLFSTHENPFSWSSSYYGIRNAVHWESYGTIQKSVLLTTSLRLFWFINNTYYNSITNAWIAAVQGTIHYKITGKIYIRNSSTVKAVMTIEFSYPPSSGATNSNASYVHQEDISVSFNNNFPIFINARFSDSGHTWTEYATSTYVY